MTSQHHRSAFARSLHRGLRSVTTVSLRDLGLTQGRYAWLLMRPYRYHRPSYGCASPRAGAES